MIEILEKLDDISRKITKNRRVRKGYTTARTGETKKFLATLDNKYYGRMQEFKAITLSDYEEEKTVYDCIKEKVIRAYAEDKKYFYLVKHPEIEDMEACYIFKVLAMNDGGLIIELDGKRTLLPLFGDAARPNLDKLATLFEEEENEELGE